MSGTIESSPDAVFVLFLVGPAMTAWGLSALKEKRLIENTPRSKVRSAALGLVELSGLARQRKPQRSPLSNLDCCWWKCRVQEYRSSGKSSHWTTVKEVGSVDPFYLEDETGRVLVDPAAAELHVPCRAFELKSASRAQVAPVLDGWGIDHTGWFGFDKRMRILEELVAERSPIYVLGELASFGAELQDRQARFLERLRLAKADPAKMAEADLNRDGAVDAQEWDAFRRKQEAEFLKEELSSKPQEETTLVKAPREGPFVVSTKSEEELLASFRRFAPLSISVGLALSGLGVWLALLLGWQPLFIVIFLGACALLGAGLKIVGRRIFGR